ncbi:hypothetical protein NDU88_001004 [Pleurodeles waltl]|uniref:Uncharacterized protein n=1 Tax=Pleurodeles waltl TaxID=8319 RepID=A0AAV7KRL0_PLEWA|nr:hypothetical protein NDU88_001004 [Pleurodeles waltl]
MSQVCGAPPRLARPPPKPGERAPTSRADHAAQRCTTRSHSDEPGKPHREARPGPSRQRQGSHQAPKEAAALTKRPNRRSARRNVRRRP